MLVHQDPIEDLRALPLVEIPELDTLVAPLRAQLTKVQGYVAAGDGHIRITLYSDSRHLRDFFYGNWGTYNEETQEIAETNIIATRREFLPNAPQLKPGTRYINPSHTLIVSLGSEYYGNVKISVRGLCSAATCMRGRGGFLHGTSLTLRETGVVIAGASGAGKTTATRALLEMCPGDIRIINDDWGWADHHTRTLQFTGEPNLHMKYRSVRTIAPTHALSPNLQLSENYEGDEENPHARLLIPRDTVFDGAVVDQAEFGVYIVIFRDTTKPFFTKQLAPDDVGLLQTAEYSAFYQRFEHFMDGSLLLLSDADVEAERNRFRSLLSQVPAVLVNNVLTPFDLAKAILEHVDRLSCQS